MLVVVSQGEDLEKKVFPAWLQLITMFKHKMLENILSIPCTLFQPVNLNFILKNRFNILYLVTFVQKLWKRAKTNFKMDAP
jgi:hypothetical protein